MTWTILFCKQRWCELKKRCSFKCLKAVELYFADGCTIDQDVVKFIIANAPYLETLTYDLRMKHKICISFPYCADLKTVEEFARKLCKGHPNDINITVIGWFLPGTDSPFSSQPWGYIPSRFWLHWLEKIHHQSNVSCFKAFNFLTICLRYIRHICNILW